MPLVRAWAVAKEFLTRALVPKDPVPIVAKDLMLLPVEQAAPQRKRSLAVNSASPNSTPAIRTQIQSWADAVRLSHYSSLNF